MGGIGYKLRMYCAVASILLFFYILYEGSNFLQYKVNAMFADQRSPKKYTIVLAQLPKSLLNKQKIEDFLREKSLKDLIEIKLITKEKCAFVSFDYPRCAKHAYIKLRDEYRSYSLPGLISYYILGAIKIYFGENEHFWLLKSYEPNDYIYKNLTSWIYLSVIIRLISYPLVIVATFLFFREILEFGDVNFS